MVFKGVYSTHGAVQALPFFHPEVCTVHMARAILIQYVYMAGPILPQFVHITGVIMGGLYTPLGGKNGRVVSKPPVLYTPLGGKMVGLFQSHLYCTHQRVEKSYTVHITA